VTGRRDTARLNGFAELCIPNTNTNTNDNTQGVRARLLAARGEKERARATLKGAQQAEREAQTMLQQALQENAALEAELARQTVSMGVGVWGGGV
jgi:hypothetical protein